MANELKIPERNNVYQKGLRNMIAYINSITPTKKLKIIEVGCWTGCGSVIFAKHFRKVICIDPWQSNIGGIADKYNMAKVEKVFDRRASENKNIYKSKMTSLEAARIYKDGNGDIQPDVVYIDAQHDYTHVKEDILAWKGIPKLFICGHDFENRFPGVKKAVREILGEPERVFIDSSWIFRIKGVK